MTKPTGRPRGRPKTKEYVTLMARVPLELADQARRYAGRKQQPMSEVLRDALQLLLEQEADVPCYVYDRNVSPAKVSDIKEAPLPVETPPVKVSDIKEAVTVPPFDTIKYRLGKLCPRAHEYNGTGQSLRVNNKAGYCLTCNAEDNRNKRTRQRQALAQTPA